MSKRNNRLLVQDILDCITKIEKYILGYTFAKFVKDSKTTDAVVRNIEIIGEASKHLSKVTKSKIDLPWKQISGMRNIIVHEYFGVDLKIVWKIAKSQLKPLKQNFEILLKELEN